MTTRRVWDGGELLYGRIAYTDREVDTRPNDTVRRRHEAFALRTEGPCLDLPRLIIARYYSPWSRRGHQRLAEERATAGAGEGRAMWKALFTRLARQTRWRCAVEGMPNPASGPVIELIAGRDAGSSLTATLAAGHPDNLIAGLLVAGRLHALAASRGRSIRFRCASRDAILRIAAPGAVHVVVRARDGRTLAGPERVAPERPWSLLAW